MIIFSTFLGSTKRGYNPTLYRSPHEYRDIVTSVNIPTSKHSAVGFEVVSSQKVQTYIKVSISSFVIIKIIINKEKTSVYSNGIRHRIKPFIMACIYAGAKLIDCNLKEQSSSSGYRGVLDRPELTVSGLTD